MNLSIFLFLTVIFSNKIQEENQQIVDMIQNGAISLATESDLENMIDGKSLGHGVQGAVYPHHHEKDKVIKVTNPYKNFQEVLNSKLLTELWAE